MKLRKLRSMDKLPKCNCGGTPTCSIPSYGYGAIECNSCGIRTRPISCNTQDDTLISQSNWYTAMTPIK
ncbi:MAG: hypothetical protein HRU18_02815 [Pseudoalteromonas sp.]|uniref:hypothetical protein n=1 Tax=Pseudoalteromonas sp. TaxID=53249 RepID=UPI001DC1324E|nr:hypothetical protein [Pseudoalteromonas sp.]NRA77116.1 hypothetical protein [Pseudoalteromonas sp.]